MGKAFACVSSILSTIFALGSTGLLTGLLAFSAYLVKKEKVEPLSNLVFDLTIVVAIVALVLFILMMVGSWSRKPCCMCCNIVLVLIMALLWAVVGLIALFQPARALSLIEVVWTRNEFKGYELAAEAKLGCCGWSSAIERCPRASTFCRDAIDARLQKDRQSVGYAGLAAAALGLIVIFFKLIHCCCVKRERRRVANAYDDSESSLKDQKRKKRNRRRPSTPSSETYSSDYYYESSSSTPPPPPKKKGKGRHGRRK